MKYVMLLWPHANARYQTEAHRLALAELRLTLAALSPEAQVGPCTALPLPALQLEVPVPLEDELLRAVRTQSLMYGLFVLHEDGALHCVAPHAEPCVGADLAGVLKYKGKTNELFLELLLNVALYSGGFAHRAGERLEVLDPMCGRGTALFVAANRGWNAVGTDVDSRDLGEAEHYLKHYLEYHRMKHALTHESRTAAGQGAAVARFEFAASAARFRAGERQHLELVHADAAQVRALFGRERFHLIACDLPYGVQHSAVGGGLEQLLQRALPAWREALKPGGTVALSFNAQTLPREKLLARMEAAGLEVLRGELWEGFRHWVEQAVTRDIAVGRRSS